MLQRPYPLTRTSVRRSRLLSLLSLSLLLWSVAAPGLHLVFDPGHQHSPFDSSCLPTSYQVDPGNDSYGAPGPGNPHQSQVDTECPLCRTLTRASDEHDLPAGMCLFASTALALGSLTELSDAPALGIPSVSRGRAPPTRAA